MFYSPLRYPGGKNKLSNFIGQICADNNIKNHYVEPFAGGLSVALSLLIEGKVQNITVNDYDRSIYAFWRCVLTHTNKLCRLIEETDINIETWKQQKEIQVNKDAASIIELGFSTLFLNRTNISGIITAGVIGGAEQKGKYKIDCRFNKKSLIDRIKLIARYKNRIKLYNLDALKLVSKVQKISNNDDTIFYFDPPYYLKGSTLYMNFYKDSQHKELTEAIKKIENMNWIISYDNATEIHKLYSWIPKDRKKIYNLNHYAHKTKIGKEVLLFSEKLIINHLGYLDSLVKK